MIVSISEQASIFGMVFVAGLMAGLFYDIIVIFKMTFKHSTILTDIEDIAYWLIIIIFVFLGLLDKNYADIRLFNIIGFFLGMIVYHFALSDIVIKILMVIIKAIKAVLKLILEIVLTPIRLIWYIIGKPIEVFFAILANYMKKVLHLSKVYGKIKRRQILDQFKFIKKKQ